jgi:hypothetical protein
MTFARASYRELGAELRKRREAAGLTCADLATRTGWSTAKVSRMEIGWHEISVVDLVYFVGMCGVYRAQAMDLIAMCRDAERKLGYWLSPHEQWLEDSLGSLIYHESTANISTTYEPQLVPGLLQTEDYARARIAAEHWRSPEDVESCVRIRMDRQRVLYPSRPAQFIFILHEQALHHTVGSAPIMHEQLLNLVLLTLLEHVTVRVVPSSAGEPWSFGGPFRLFEYTEHRPLVYLDAHASGLFLEDKDFVEPYRTLVPAFSEVALDEGQSRQLIATRASAYDDQRSERDGGHCLEEEQF